DPPADDDWAVPMSRSSTERRVDIARDGVADVQHPVLHVEDVQQTARGDRARPRRAVRPRSVQPSAADCVAGCAGAVGDEHERPPVSSPDRWLAEYLGWPGCIDLLKLATGPRPSGPPAPVQPVE